MKTIIATLLGTTTVAAAGGMTLPIRGVHSIERAGALIAGSEDADSLWLNPAGLANLAGSNALLFDAAYVNQFVDYARIDSGGNQMASVSNDYPGIAVPTIAAAFSLSDKLVVGAGFTAPYAGLHRYEGEATKYSSISLAETTFLMINVGVAYKPAPNVRVGVALSNMIAVLKSQVMLSGCPGQTICAPEDPEFDAATKVDVHDFVAPSIVAGVQWDVSKDVTIGAMAQSPTWISADGTVATRLPASGYFEGSMVVGDSMNVSFELPPIFRVGVEARPTARLRVEAALAVELWSMHDDMRLTTSGVRIEGAAGVGTYDLSPLRIPRNYENSYAPSVGGEYRVGRMQVGAGYSYETAAAPKQYVSTLTVDSAKHIFGIGGGYVGGGWKIGGALGYVMMSDVDVALGEARVPQLTPLRDQPSEIFVNAGSYRAKYFLGGVQVAKTF